MKAAMEGHRGNELPDYIMIDLNSRFILNMGPHMKDHMRIMFEMEAAHWYYKDFITKNTLEKLPNIGLKEFARQMYRFISNKGLVNLPEKDFDGVYDKWTKYKFAIPTFGGILIDPEMQHCLMVQHFSNKVSWGFPKGKRNQEENAEKCAIREVLEETGYDCSNLLDKEDFFETFKKVDDMEKRERLYPVVGVPLTTAFQTRTRQEIKDIKWFEINLLPNHKADTNSPANPDYNPAFFHTAFAFIGQLKKWIKKRKKQYQPWQFGQRQGEVDRRQENYQRQKQQYAQGNQSEYQDYMDLLQRNNAGQQWKADRMEGDERGKQGRTEGGRGGKQRKQGAVEEQEKSNWQRRGAGGEGGERNSRQRGGQRGGDSRAREPLLPRPDLAPQAPPPQVQIMQRGKSAQPNRGDQQASLLQVDSRVQGRRSAGQQKVVDSDRRKLSDGSRQVHPQSDSDSSLLPPVPRCQAWDNFRLDVDAIMAILEKAFKK